MLKKLLEMILNSKGIKTTAKVGGGALSGGALVFIMINYVNAKDEAVRDYTDGKHGIVIAQVKNVETQLSNVRTQVASSEYKMLKAK